ncbi:HSF-type DNA-binding-domain-containing protein [Halteromyces radiatus]|uniref:HSF-type DNA-binding-domain-containing protein n=1 Tax=Halteromyces radiatus TaxID=101107 RepID=UPI00221F2578|nr:HSF-type DNA-binding-domain-containing protein [Halteromyces radiatus]KAI8076746.1 HSF-type DNA-binding-domain-containing protein [Halteromyces radiatus]
MAFQYEPTIKHADQNQASSSAETFTFRVEPTSVPVFITKLCMMVNDQTVQEMISWSEDGERFCVFDIPGFSKVVLPQYFKHSNWPSFVRQLNMYGFHKVNDNFSTRHGQLICEFHHPMFYRNGRNALRKIRRNSRKSISTNTDPFLHHSPRQIQQQEQDQLQQKQERDHYLQQYQYHPQQDPLHHQEQKHQQLQILNPPSTSSSTKSSMPISSLLSSNDDDYNDEDTTSFYDPPTADITSTTDISDTSNNNDDYYSQSNQYQTNETMDERRNGSESYMLLRRELGQLQAKTSNLNTEITHLKQHVAKQQQVTKEQKKKKKGGRMGKKRDGKKDPKRMKKKSVTF